LKNKEKMVASPVGVEQIRNTSKGDTRNCGKGTRKTSSFITDEEEGEPREKKRTL